MATPGSQMWSVGRAVDDFSLFHVLKCKEWRSKVGVDLELRCIIVYIRHLAVGGSFHGVKEDFWLFNALITEPTLHTNNH